MIDPIHASRGQDLPRAENKTAGIKEDLHAADAEVASLYYQSTITSYSCWKGESTQASLAIQDKEVKKSLLGRAKDWLWGIFGWGQKQPITQAESENVDSDDSEPVQDPFAGGTPKLETPESQDHIRLSQSLNETIQRINELNQRLEKIAASGEELEKSNSAELDKLFYLLLVHSSLQQKHLKHLKNQVANEDLFRHHEKNKDLQKLYYDLVDAINQGIKQRGILKWINAGLTGITVGGMAAGFALGGPLSFITVGTALSFLGKGSTLLSDGILKYRNDEKTGDLVVIKQDSKATSTKKREKLTEMQHNDEDIATLLKKIRHHLDNHRNAEKANFGRPS